MAPEHCAGGICMSTAPRIAVDIGGTFTDAVLQKY
ncbi:MAG TPA: hypothetical protein EYP93_07695 [Gammaproteobacteria bacterium]|nr:hypothetical protein [Gammaproteobacteria bacterium]